MLRTVEVVTFKIDSFRRWSAAKAEPRWHNVGNDFGAAHSSSRRDPLNPTGANRHNRLDDCGGCGVGLRGMEGTESRSTCIRWGQRYRAFLGVVVLWRFLASDAHADVEKRAARVAGALLFALPAYVAVTSVTSLPGYSEPNRPFWG
jgi:hypothetical protein